MFDGSVLTQTESAHRVQPSSEARRLPSMGFPKRQWLLASSGIDGKISQTFFVESNEHFPVDSQIYSGLQTQDDLL